MLTSPNLKLDGKLPSMMDQMQPGQFYCGDNLRLLRGHPGESVDLCYIDPPFCSMRSYHHLSNHWKAAGTAEQTPAFDDRWLWDEAATLGLTEIQSQQPALYDLVQALGLVVGRGGMLAYLVSLALRLVEIHRILKPSGSFYLHCDPTASHYLKLLCDLVFSTAQNRGRFLNEIIWSYRSGGVAKTKWLARKHDVILFYSKGREFRITPIRERQYLGKRFMDSQIDAQGRHYCDTYLRDVLQAEVTTVTEEGLLQNYSLRPVLNLSRERLGYGTQKPLGLLEILIRLASHEGQLVLDAYCGSGTSLAAAERLGRRWIGIDCNPQAIAIAQQRLQKIVLEVN